MSLSSIVKVRDELLFKEETRNCFFSSDANGLMKARQAKEKIISQQNEIQDLKNNLDIINTKLNKLIENLGK